MGVWELRFVTRDWRILRRGAWGPGSGYRTSAITAIVRMADSVGIPMVGRFGGWSVHQRFD